ncbi:hypothetical protein NDU88_005402, partial [Pleurodeles waltl]
MRLTRSPLRVRFAQLYLVRPSELERVHITLQSLGNAWIYVVDVGPGLRRRPEECCLEDSSLSISTVVHVRTSISDISASEIVVRA